MTSETSSCAGFFQDHANTAAINQYFQQLNSQTTAASSNNNLANSNSDSGNDGSITGRSTSSGDSTRSSVSSNDSSKSGRNSGSGAANGNVITAGSGNSNTNQWLNMQQQQQQQQQNQQHLQQQTHHQQQQQHQQQHNNQQQQQNHNHQQHNHQQHQQQHQQQQQHLHHQSLHQTHHSNSQHQQQLQQHQQQQQLQHQQQQQHQQLSAALSQSLQQNLAAASASAAAAAAAASVTTNPHSIFGSGNFHYKTNNSWSIPSLSCYQRIYNENAHYQRNFNNNTNNNNNNNNNNDSANVAQNVANNSNSNNSSSNNNNNNSSSNNNSSNNSNNSNNNGRKSPFLGFICKTNGKSTSNSKEVICPDDKYKEEGDLWNVEAQTAFLGPNLWEKTLPYDADLKYADLDEFLSENNIPDGLPGTHLGHSSSLGHRSDSLSHAAGLSLGLGHITTKRERSPSPSDCISPDTLNPPSPAESIFDIPAFSFASSGRDFDPRTRAFSDEELKPQPMIKKSRKQFVPDELKDDKYWARRRKNNIAAKRSRDARRQKENQIAMRARYLEKENATLHQEVEQLKQENMDLRARLSKFQDV
ncbi:protein kinase 4 isoform X2 [Calliphora vicina]|uniref:protein kinase 4 isoform X2 n=1 Tax=Calliphora vicina TaxID=7373 RepID=UPI00325B6790